MRNLISKKFGGIKQKYIFIPLKSKAFADILDAITIEIKNNNVTAKEAMLLIKSFKANKKAWVKFKSVKGRKNLFCECEVITKSSKKIKTALSCDIVIESELLHGTPKSLKLFKKEKKYTSREWKKPDDGFVDDITYPPVEEELTELGYELYKDWQEEIRASGMSAEAYKLKYYFPHGYTTRRG